MIWQARKMGHTQRERGRQTAQGKNAEGLPMRRQNLRADLKQLFFRNLAYLIFYRVLKFFFSTFLRFGYNALVVVLADSRVVLEAIHQ